MFSSYDPITFESQSKFLRFFSYFGGPLQFLAFLVTAFGTLLVAQLSQKLRFYGFCAWFVSNLLWILWATSNKGHGGVLLTYIMNFLFNLLGIYNNFRGS